MSALTFPLARQNLVDLMMVETVTWRLTENQELSGLGGGETLAADLAPRLWEADVSTVEQDLDATEALHGRFLTLDGAIQSFHLYDPSRPYPATDPMGSLLLGSAVTVQAIETNRKEITLAGLPAGFVLPMGTMLSIEGGSPTRTALLKLAAPATANGGGVLGPVELRPHLRPWIVNTLAVTLRKPVAKVKLVPRSLAVVPVTTVTSRLRFTARQTLAAG